MVKEERLQVILQQLDRDNKVQLGDMSRLLNVSEDTVRRDIKELDMQGLLKAVRGGAIAHSRTPRHYRDRENYDIGQKRIIAEKALAFLKNGQVVFFDGGTSVLELAKRLPHDLYITVVTNSFPVVNVLEDHPNATVIFAGGKLNKMSFTTIGHQTIKTFNSVRADVYFLGISSLHTMGITSKGYEDAAVKKVMIQMASQVIALTTLEKINTAEAFYIGPLTAIDTIITEADPDSPQLIPYKEAGITIV